MRIIAGRWRGRVITAPQGSDTRPTSDRVREAMFSSIVSRVGDIAGLRVLDLYAGSGALGMEALSRGASHVTFVEPDRRACSAIRKNLGSLGATSGEASVMQTTAERYAAGATGDGTVSLLFADPPYRIDAARVTQVLEALVASGQLEPGALVVYEHGARVTVTWPEGFAAVASRTYGDTAVSYAEYEGLSATL